MGNYTYKYQGNLIPSYKASSLQKIRDPNLHCNQKPIPYTRPTVRFQVLENLGFKIFRKWYVDKFCRLSRNSGYGTHEVEQAKTACVFTEGPPQKELFSIPFSSESQDGSRSSLHNDGFLPGMMGTNNSSHGY
jgi:hypothetical protein